MATNNGVKLKKEKIAYCLNDNRQYTIDNFYETKSKFVGNARVIPYCKDCCEEILREYLKTKGNLESALWFTCAKLDIPFIKNVFEATEKYKTAFQNRAKTEKKDEDYDIFKYYYMFLWGSKSMQKKTDEWNDFSDTDVALGEIASVKKSEEALKQDCEKFELDWGKQSVEDYQFLEYRYDVYTEGKPLKPAQEALYRQLCLVELRKRNKESKTDLLNNQDIGESTKEEQDMMIKLMDKLKISNFAEDKDKSDIDKLIEKQIWEVENTEPCEIVDREYYKDYCDIGKKWGQQILRSIKNLVAGSKEYPDINKDSSEW